MSYRTDRVEIVRTFQYNDSVNDHFEREPYSVLIRSREEGGGKMDFFWLCTLLGFLEVRGYQLENASLQV